MERVVIGFMGGLLVMAVFVVMLHETSLLWPNEGLSEEDQVSREVAGFCPDYSDNYLLVAGLVAKVRPDAAKVQMHPSLTNATFSPDSRQIVFPSEEQDGSWALYLMDPWSDETERLTTSSGSDWHPSWSPDGSKILFSRREGEDRVSSIYVVDTETKVERRLTDPTAGFTDEYAVWVPGGEQIVFVRRDNTEPFGRDRLFFTNLDGSGLKEIEIGDGHREWELLPVWSPDQNTMVFATRKVTQATIDIGDYLATRTSKDESFLIAANAEGGDQVVLGHYPPSNVARFYSVRFSDDGSKVIYNSTNTEGRTEISYVDLESGVSHDITQVCYP